MVYEVAVMPTRLVGGTAFADETTINKDAATARLLFLMLDTLSFMPTGTWPLARRHPLVGVHLSIPAPCERL